MSINNCLSYFSLREKVLWLGSVLLVLLSFYLTPDKSYLNLIASLIGVTSLIFIAKGNPVGLGMSIIFCLMYGAISYTFAYYGEMITYMGMSAPMALIALVAWLRHPADEKSSQVEIATMGAKDIFIMFLVTGVITVIFYYILDWLNTTNLALSTFSVTTSFLAVYMTYKRSPYYALGYAANDLVLIVMWLLATMENTEYFSVVICFVAFLANDIYGFWNWKQMQKAQSIK